MIELDSEVAVSYSAIVPCGQRVVMDPLRDGLVIDSSGKFTVNVEFARIEMTKDSRLYLVQVLGGRCLPEYPGVRELPSETRIHSRMVNEIGLCAILQPAYRRIIARQYGIFIEVEVFPNPAYGDAPPDYSPVSCEVKLHGKVIPWDRTMALYSIDNSHVVVDSRPQLKVV